MLVILFPQASSSHVESEADFHTLVDVHHESILKRHQNISQEKAGQQDET